MRCQAAELLQFALARVQLAASEPADADAIRLRQADVLKLLTGHYHNTRVSQWTPVL